jgi:hypothetical protein
MPMTDLINSLETTCRLLGAFTHSQPPGSDLHRLADDALEASYAFLDKLALSLPPVTKPPLDLTAD